MVISVKAKCSECTALCINEGRYSCTLGVKIDSNEVDGRDVAPKPVGKCYKPLTSEELEDAIKLVERNS